MNRLGTGSFPRSKFRRADPADGIVWLTGASQGIGAALAHALAARGFTLALTARNEGALRALAGEFPGRAFAFPADVGSDKAMAECYEAISATHGPIGTVIANAGIYTPLAAEAFDIAAFTTCINVNLLGAARQIAPAARAMAERKRGHICVVSSATGFGGMPTASAYGASKAALINFAECLKIELDPLGIGVSLAIPGFVDTPAQETNDFPKPFMVSADEAARRIVEGMMRGDFEITFPRRFTWPLGAIYALPRSIHVNLVRRQTGWNKRRPVATGPEQAGEGPSGFST